MLAVSNGRTVKSVSTTGPRLSLSSGIGASAGETGPAQGTAEGAGPVENGHGIGAISQLRSARTPPQGPYCIRLGQLSGASTPSVCNPFPKPPPHIRGRHSASRQHRLRSSAPVEPVGQHGLRWPARVALVSTVEPVGRPLLILVHRVKLC